MKENLSEIIFILDRSGSMASLKTDAIGGFNTFLEAQQKCEGEANFTLVLFDHEYSLTYDAKNIKEVVPLDDETYVPRGSTALFDALGRVVNAVGSRLHNTPEEDRPSKVLVAILTDGEENASKEFNKAKINEMITHQREKYSWEFLFLAANQDAMAEGTSLGINPHMTMTYSATSAGVGAVFDSFTRATTSYRSTGIIDNLNDTKEEA